MVPLLPDSSWEFHDSFVPSETPGPLIFSANVTNEACSVKRLPGSRTIRDVMITSGRGSFQRLHRAFRRFREKQAAANEHNSQVEEERMENDVMAAAGSLHQKPREVCITEDTASIDLGWFENTKLNRVKNGTLDVCYRWAFAIGIRWADIRQESKRGFVKRPAEAMGCRSGRRRRDSSFQKTTSGGTSCFSRRAT